MSIKLKILLKEITYNSVLFFSPIPFVSDFSSVVEQSSFLIHETLNTVNQVGIQFWCCYYCNCKRWQ